MNQMANVAGQYGAASAPPRGPPPSHPSSSGDVPPGGSRFSALVEQLKAEYEGITSEKGTHVRTIQEGYERKVQEQLRELSAMEAALYDLDRKHIEMKERYEAEIARLKAQLPQDQLQQQQLQQHAQVATVASGQQPQQQHEVMPGVEVAQPHQQQPQPPRQVHHGPPGAVTLGRAPLPVKMQPQPVVVARTGALTAQQQQQPRQHVDQQQPGQLPQQYATAQMYTMAAPQQMTPPEVAPPPAPPGTIPTAGAPGPQPPPPSGSGMTYRMEAPPPGRMYATVGGSATAVPPGAAPMAPPHEGQENAGMGAMPAVDSQGRMPPSQPPPPRAGVGGGAQ